MHISDVPFSVIDWSKVTPTEHPGETGKAIWRCAVPGGAGSGSGYSSIVISEGAGVRQYVQLMGAGTGCIGVNAKTGKFLWRYDGASKNSPANIPTPVAHDSYVYTSGAKTGGGLVSLKADGDILPVRALYNETGETNIGLNPLTCKEPVMFHRSADLIHVMGASLALRISAP